MFGWLWGAKKAVETLDNSPTAQKATDGLIAGIDALIHTEEERVHENQETIRLIHRFWERFNEENSMQSMARRELAKMTFKAFFALIFMGVGVKALGMVWPHINPLAESIVQFIKLILFLVNAVALTYFVPHQVSKVFTYKKEK